MTAGICRYCQCTESAPCPGGCAWASAEQTLCTACAPAVDTAIELVRALGVSLGPEGGAVARLVTTRFERLPPEEQAALVQLCRRLVESMREGIADALHEEAVDAIRQIDRISACLLERVPSEVGEDDSAADVVLRLLERQERQASGLIALPGGRP